MSIIKCYRERTMVTSLKERENKRVRDKAMNVLEHSSQKAMNVRDKCYTRTLRRLTGEQQLLILHCSFSVVILCCYTLLLLFSLTHCCYSVVITLTVVTLLLLFL